VVIEQIERTESRVLIWAVVVLDVVGEYASQMPLALDRQRWMSSDLATSTKRSA
jgi:hypothetical protein